LDLKTDFPPIPPGSLSDKAMGGLGSSTRRGVRSTQSSTLWPRRNMGSVEARRPALISLKKQGSPRIA